MTSLHSGNTDEVAGERAEQPSSPARVPDFFVVGHPKSGTTALYEMLRRHPQIFMPELKETRFFARELHPRAGPGDPSPRTLEEYVALFAAAGSEQRAGEASPSYLRSRLAAQRIAELRADARIIAILREPVSFLHSLHMELMRDHAETESSLAKALALGPERRAAEARGGAPGLVYSDYVEYVEQLRRYHAVFPREQVLVLIYDDFRADNEATLRRVMSFLGVAPDWPIEVKEVNPSVRVRSPQRQRDDALALSRARPARACVEGAVHVLPARARRRGLGVVQRRVVYGSPRGLDEALERELRERFGGEVAALSDYLGRDLVTLWGYDRLER